MGKSEQIRDKSQHGLIFVLIVPVILILWAKFTSNVVTIHLPVNQLTGYVLFFMGAVLVCSGMWNLWRSDKSLPVNDFPSTQFFKSGINGNISLNICSGAVLISFGLSAITRSASGFWLVSPVFTLLMAIYVSVFKNGKAQSVFRNQVYKSFLSLPASSNIMPSLSERLSSYFLVFVPWLLIYKAFIFIGAPDDAISTNLPFEEHLPVWEFTTLFYSFAFLFSLLVPMVVRTRRQLKHFITDVWFTIVFVGIIYLVFPLVIEQREFVPHSFLGRLILYERSIDGESGALPSCHVIWAFLAAFYFRRSFAGYKWVWYVLAILISISCITVGAHSIFDVIAGYITFLIIIYRHYIRNFLMQIAEILSKKRKERKFGPFKIMNYGLITGAAGFTGALLAGFFLGRQYILVVSLILIFIIVAINILIKLAEKQGRLTIPFISYKGLICGIITCIIVSLIFSIDIFILLASFAMAAPWVMAIGCLGSHHPTQLYSIGFNIITGLVMIRLFNIGISSSFIAGMYLIFTGTGRFVIESFSSEAGFPYLEDMKVSQWIAILCALSGIIFTAIPGSAILVFQPNFLSLILATGIGILVTVASEFELPQPKRHLARRGTNFFN